MPMQTKMMEKRHMQKVQREQYKLEVVEPIALIGIAQRV
jgi:hypothetical protein